MRTKIILFILFLSTILLSQNTIPSQRIRWHHGPTSTRPLNPTIFTLYWNTDSSFAQYWDGDSWENLLGISEVVDTVIVIVQDSIADIYPIPHDSLDTDTIWVMADSGLGGGGTVEIGDTTNLQVHVDGVTTIILKDTVRADTTNTIATRFHEDSLHWRSISKYRFPEYDDMVLWNYNDFQTAQDSVDVCYGVEYATNYNYILAERDAAASDSHYIHLHWSFIAPRDVSDITDTLFIFRYKTTDADTMNCGVLPIITEGTTVRYNPVSIVASTTWDTIAVRKSYGTLNLITEGDQFSLDIRFKVDGDSCYGEMLEERWH